MTGADILGRCRYFGCVHIVGGIHTFNGQRSAYWLYYTVEKHVVAYHNRSIHIMIYKRPCVVQANHKSEKWQIWTRHRVRDPY